MQIAIFVGHRPRPPSSSGAPLFPFSFFFLSSFPFFSRSGIAVGAKTTRNEMQSTRQTRGLLLAPMPGAAVGSGILNSIGAVLPRRWIVRACRDGL
jgi:hypothetical protein